MLKMMKQSEACLQKRSTPLQDIILQTAENHNQSYHKTRCHSIEEYHYWLTAMQTWRGTGNSGIRASLQVIQTNPAHENCNKRQENPWLSEVTGRIIMIQRCEPALNMCGGRTIFWMIFEPKISALKTTKEPFRFNIMKQIFGRIMTVGEQGWYASRIWTFWRSDSSFGVIWSVFFFGYRSFVLKWEIRNCRWKNKHKALHFHLQRWLEIKLNEDECRWLNLESDR